MIVVDRNTKHVIHADPITPAQREKLWEAVVRASGEPLIRAALDEMKGAQHEKG